MKETYNMEIFTGGEWEEPGAHLSGRRGTGRSSAVLVEGDNYNTGKYWKDLRDE
ncbi:MAG: hypothetical protein IPI69_16300 [Bacteroidales bacterium]|nr:hypothetical protein [Bacteroidales bacterium]